MLFNRIVAAYDGSKESEKALEKAVELANSTPGAKLHIVHVYQFPAVYLADGFVMANNLNKELMERAEKLVSDLKQRLSETGMEAHVELLYGPPADSILKFAKEREADLIVIGSRGLSGIKELVLGSVSHNVVQRSPIPVLVVK